MATQLEHLLARVASLDSSLADALEKELEKRTTAVEFGIHFATHSPEIVRLPRRRVAVQDKVVLQTDVERFPEIYRVTSIGARTVQLIAKSGSRLTAKLKDVVPIAEFGDPIYPGMRSLGSAGSPSIGTPSHVVIQGENFHALQTLRYTHAASVDLIYIDPPYNTGNKAENKWKYNDKYVDDTSGYRPSLWLSFMERRLRLARELLKPTGAIMVSIGDGEQHRLRMLMDKVFQTENHVAQLAVEMSTTSGPKTTNAQQGTIVKNVEYVLIYRRSAAFDTHVRHTPLYDGIDKWDTNYPLWINDDGTTESLYSHLDSQPEIREDIERLLLTHSAGPKKGQFVGARGMDLLIAGSKPAKEFITRNLARIGRTDTAPSSAKTVDVEVGRWVTHATPEREYMITRSSSGKLWQIYTLDRNYRVSDDYVPRFGRTVIRGDLWRGFHSDMGHVTSEGNVAFNNGKKPLRLIRQLIQWANNSRDAVILDFFGGSGTTTHAVMQLNAADGGSRQSILVTNNELNAVNDEAMRERGKYPGDEEYEALGVFRAVTRPRIESVVSGVRPDGRPSKHQGIDQSVEFFELTYESADQVAFGDAYASVDPLLWLKAGSTGSRIGQPGDEPFMFADSYGVLFSPDAVARFVAEVAKRPEIRHAFAVTEDDSFFASLRSQLPGSVPCTRLYESYLTTFAINTSGAV
ncbi:site-specific DNA-methyltransferase [Microbacterium sp.]|uniref:site-specific DNA-methyltransferase n=1 Tax=Microbacterium sp. TaxID=51671 RepID=UPI002811A648|nr:site-specific DNA-methyltransferase [Microbacterium sp.]